MHNFLDESFNIYSLNLVRAGDKVKYPRLAIFFRIIGVLRSCSEIEFRHEQIFFFDPCIMLMQRTGSKLHGERLPMFACTGAAFQSVGMHVCYLVTLSG